MNKTDINVQVSDTEQQKELIKILKRYKQRIFLNSEILHPNFIGYAVYSGNWDEWCSGPNLKTLIGIGKLKEFLKNEQDEQRIR